MQEFAVITCFFNPCNYERRKICYERFAEGLRQQNVELWTIEAIIEGQSPFVEASPRVFHVEMLGDDWIWQKERLLNMLLDQLPERINKVAWVDADLLFKNPNWARMAVDSLETWSAIQLFDHVHYLGPDDTITTWSQSHRIESMASVAFHNPTAATNLTVAAPGFAWAARRSLLKKHRFYESNIDGSCDTVMATSMLGLFHSYIFRQGSPAMNEKAMEYGKRIYADVCGYVGYIPVTLHHIWHGDFENRLYAEKTHRLSELRFNPDKDITINPTTGLFQWTPSASLDLRSFMRETFIAKKEDG